MKCTPGMIVCLGLGLGQLLSGAGQAHAQTAVHFGNFAPRDDAAGGRVSLRVGDTIVASSVPYLTLQQGLSLPAGDIQLTLLDEGGAVLAQRQARLLVDLPYTIYAAGNGSDREVELRVVRESGRPLREELFSLQLYSAALGLPDTLTVQVRCGLTQGDGTLGYGTEAVGRLSARADGFGCVIRVHAGPVAGGIVAETALLPIEGGLQRLVLSGDGNNQPWQLDVFEAIERARPVLPPDAGMDGLWFDPGDSGSGLTLMVEENAEGLPWVTGVFYGYGFDGSPTWALLEGEANQPVAVGTAQAIRVLESVGGTAQGDRQPVRMALGVASLDFHSCREATLYLRADRPRMPQRLGRRSTDINEQVFRLQRLLPIDACVSAAVGPKAAAGAP